MPIKTSTPDLDDPRVHSEGRTPRTNSPVHAVQALLSWAVVVGILAQIYAAGLMIYGRPQIHQLLGYGVMLTAYLSTATSLASFGWRRPSRLACGAALLLTLQPVFVFVLASVSPYLAALHALNGALALLLATAATAESRALTRSSPTG